MGNNKLGHETAVEQKTASASSWKSV